MALAAAMAGCRTVSQTTEATTRVVDQSVEVGTDQEAK
jgi:hypothetical protein